MYRIYKFQLIIHSAPKGKGAQSIQSARLSFQSSELDPPPLHPQGSVAPPHFGSNGGKHTSCGGGPNSDDGTDILVLYVYFNPLTVGEVGIKACKFKFVFSVHISR
jgi:hypothetical protein